MCDKSGQRMDIPGRTGYASAVKEKGCRTVDRVGMRDTVGLRTMRKEENDLVQRGG